MSTYTQEVGQKLNSLLEKTYDAQRGYSNAAEATDHVQLKRCPQSRSKTLAALGALAGPAMSRNRLI